MKRRAYSFIAIIGIGLVNVPFDSYAKRNIVERLFASSLQYKGNLIKKVYLPFVKLKRLKTIKEKRYQRNSSQNIRSNYDNLHGFYHNSTARRNSGYPSNLIAVTSWASTGIKPDLNLGRWCQIGKANWINFFNTGLPGPKAYLKGQFPFVEIKPPNVPFNNSITKMVPVDSLQWPPGLEAWKGFLGQRVIKR